MFYLDVKDKESLFRSDSFRRNDSLRIKRGFPDGFDMQFNNKQLYIQKNLKNNQIRKYVFVPLVFSIFSIDITDKLDWKVSDEKIKIGNYNCQKAQLNYGDRNWTAWFTTDISISDGPYVFKNLPGLIVKIYDENKDFDFELIQVKNFKWKELYPVKSQKRITWKDFEKLQDDFYKDPFAMINKSDIKSYDGAGNEIKTNLKEMRDNRQAQIRGKNNPIELNHKVKY